MITFSDYFFSVHPVEKVAQVSLLARYTHTHIHIYISASLHSFCKLTFAKKLDNLCVFILALFLFALLLKLET